MNDMKKILGLLFSASLLVSCHTDKTKRNYEYFPNMYYAVGYETYQAVPFLPNGTAAGLPADHTIARGHIPYELENTVDGKIASRTQPNRITDFDDKAAASGKALFDAYCATCHGTKGDGQGTLVQREKILGVPSYADAARDITVGSTYHVIYYGINAMGSYASQLNENERWLVANYVMQLKQELTK